MTGWAPAISPGGNGFVKVITSSLKERKIQGVPKNELSECCWSQSSYLSRIIFVEKKLLCGEIWSFYKEFEQFMEFYQSLCRFFPNLYGEKSACRKSVRRKNDEDEVWAHCAPLVTYLRITGQIHLTLPNYEFAFYPIKLSHFAKKYSSSKIPKFHKGGPLRIGSNATLTNKSFKSQKLFWRVLGIQTSWILLYMVNHS